MEVHDAAPRVRIERACRAWGTDVVMDGCRAALRDGEVAPRMLVVLGGAHAARLLDAGLPDHQRYWLRVWGARGLLWAGPGDDLGVLRGGLRDEAWRVREMCCKVVARHLVGDLLTEVAELEVDAVARVRAAALRATIRLADADA